MRPMRFNTMQDLHDGICRKLVYAHTDELDAHSSMEVEMSHVIAESKSMEWDYDISRLWVPESRWRMMVKQYINPEALNEWLALCEYRFGVAKKRGAAVLRTNTVASRVGGKGTVRNLGSCMLTISFSLRPTPVITLHSRTCYMGYLSALDLTTAHVCARLVAERMGLDVRSFRFVWFLESAQYHGFRTAAFAWGTEEEYARFLDAPCGPEYPAMFNARKHHDKFAQQDAEGLLYSGMPFTSYRRVRKRFHTEMKGYDYASQFTDLSTGKSDHKAYKPLPPTHVSTLDFSAIGVS